MEHACFGIPYGEVLQDRIELGRDRILAESEDGSHAHGVLSGDRRDDGNAVGTQNGKGLDVGLDACPPGRVGSSYGEKNVGHVSLVSFRLGLCLMDHLFG